MQFSSFCPAEQKLICQGTKDPSENKEIPRPGPGGSRENLSSNRSPHAFRPSPSPGCRCRLHPKINKWQQVRSTPLPARTPRARSRLPAPAAPTLLAATGQGASPGRRRLAAPPLVPRSPAEGPAEPSRGRRGAWRWAQDTARPEENSCPRQGSGGRRARTGPAVTYRRLMVPRRLSSVLALTNCARKPRESLGSRAEPHSGPFKRGRARGPPGLLPLVRFAGSS